METPIIPHRDTTDLVELEVEVIFENGDYEYYETFETFTNSNKITICEKGYFDGEGKEITTREELKKRGIAAINIYECVSRVIEWDANLPPKPEVLKNG